MTIEFSRVEPSDKREHSHFRWLKYEHCCDFDDRVGRESCVLPNMHREKAHEGNQNQPGEKIEQIQSDGRSMDETLPNDRRQANQ